MTEKLTAPFEAAIDRFKRAGLPEECQPGLGYFCTYTPIEVLHAAGFTPIRITGGAGTVENAYAHMPDFICPFIKRSLEKALNGEYAFLSGIVQGYSCDAACGAINIWQAAIGGDIYHTLPLPYNDTPAAKAFFKSALAELIEKLNAAGGVFTESRLQTSLALYEAIRYRLLDLYKRPFSGHSPLTARQMLIIMEAAAVTPPETYLDMLKALENDLETAGIRENPGIPVMISGSLVEDAGIIDMIESAGGRIAADDLCNGYRPLVPPASDGNTPIARLINRYMQRMPCPARARAEDRFPVLMDLMDRSGATGLIFVLQKFCTPHLSDFPSLADAFKEKGLPALLLEMDESWEPGGQARTRLESFFEMLGA